jgi:hypothetical protein
MPKHREWYIRSDLIVALFANYKDIVKNSCNFSFAHFNCRSILANFDLFSGFMEMEDCDVVGISETWLTQNVLNQTLSIGNYKIVRNDRKARGGGVAFYLRQHLQHRLVDVSGSVPVVSQLEHLWISIKLGGQSACLGTL